MTYCLFGTESIYYMPHTASYNNLKGKNEYFSICDDKIAVFYNSW